MVTFNFTNTVLEEGMTFNFGSWVCIANDAGNFRWHLIDNKKMEGPTMLPHNNLDEFIDNLDEMLLPDLAREVGKESNFNPAPTDAVPGLLRSD